MLDLPAVADVFVLECVRPLDAATRLRENASVAVTSVRVAVRQLADAVMLGSVGFWKLILTEVSSPFGKPPEVMYATEAALERGAQDALSPARSVPENEEIAMERATAGAVTLWSACRFLPPGGNISGRMVRIAEWENYAVV